MKDTPPEVQARFREMMMARSPGERLGMAGRMFQTAKTLIAAGLRHEHGQLDRRQLRRLMFLRLYGNDLSPDEVRRIAERMGV